MRTKPPSKLTRKEKEKKPQAINRTQNKFSSPLPDIHPKSENQAHFMQSLEENQLVIAAGCAGTGKSLLTLHHAAKQLLLGHVKRVVLIRAYQPLAGRSIGFLPGELEDKLRPYYAQTLSYLEDFLTPARVEVWLKSKTIEICSLETIRGRSWDDSIIHVEESQNLFPEEIQALTTRIGTGSQMIFTGDNSGIQTDVKSKKDGLSYLLGIIKKYSIQSASVTCFTYDDIFRSDITKDFVIAYDKELYENQFPKVEHPKSKQKQETL